MNNDSQEWKPTRQSLRIVLLYDRGSMIEIIVALVPKVSFQKSDYLHKRLFPYIKSLVTFSKVFACIRDHPVAVIVRSFSAP